MTKKSFVQIFFILIICSCLGAALVVLAYAIPEFLVDRNIQSSLDLLQKENADKEWTEIYTHGWSGNLDSTTDWRIFLDARTDKGQSLLRTAFGTYSRMWNGYMVLIRPLLVFFSYSQIRFFFGVIVFLLIGYILLLLYRKLGEGTSLSFLIALIAVNVILIPFNIITSIFTIAALSAGIWILKRYDPKMGLAGLGRFFLMAGILDIYFDMFTAPLLVLGVPLMILLLIDAKSGDLSLFDEIKKIIFCSFMWGIGYGLFWFMKWAISSFFTGTNVVADAIDTMLFRIDGETTGQRGDILYSIEKNLGALLPTNGENIVPLFAVLAVLLVCMIVFLVRSGVKRKDSVRYIPCFIVALYPFLWYAIICNHSIIHATIYAYRLLIIPIFGILSVYFELINSKKTGE